MVLNNILVGCPDLLIKDSDKLLKQASKSKENKQLNKYNILFDLCTFFVFDAIKKKNEQKNEQKSKKHKMNRNWFLGLPLRYNFDTVYLDYCSSR